MRSTEAVTISATETHSAPSTINISVDGHTLAANEGELVVQAILREKEIPHVCYGWL